MADGLVAYVGQNREAGLSVGINHTNVLELRSKEPDLGRTLFSYYVHVERPTVKRGDRVKQGQVIAYSGPHWVGDHLHFEMNPRWAYTGWINPFLVYAGVLDDASLASKEIDIPYTDGTKVYPEGSRLIWPVACKPRAAG